MDAQLVLDAGGVTHGVAALDLTVVVPPMILGAHWLWRSRPWGHVISAGMLVQGLLIVADLLVTAPFHSAARIPHAWTMVPLWAAMGAGFAAGAALLLWPRRRGGAARAAAAGMLLCAVAPARALDAGARPPNAIEVSPISPLMHIYAVQYARALDERNEAIVGVAYADLFGFGLVRGNKPSGFGQEGEQTFRAPVFFVGARF